MDKRKVGHFEAATKDVASVVNKFHANNAGAGLSCEGLRDNR